MYSGEKLKHMENSFLLLDGFDDVTFEEEHLFEIIDVINELTEGEFEFIIQGSRYYKKFRGMAK
jgi:hypothetical protein